ncbi:MAG: hypothetical protein C0469_00130 [Cyanobacteria bacterium DS2.3.42]|nr:hypothetical protein [Cyanobacteria bacterium DS2.3.42]
MIVCSCKVVSDHKIEDAVRRGLKWKRLVKETQIATGCGVCARHAKSIFDKAKANSSGESQAERLPMFSAGSASSPKEKRCNEKRKSR